MENDITHELELAQGIESGLERVRGKEAAAGELGVMRPRAARFARLCLAAVALAGTGQQAGAQVVNEWTWTNADDIHPFVFEAPCNWSTCPTGVSTTDRLVFSNGPRRPATAIPIRVWDNTSDVNPNYRVGNVGQMHIKGSTSVTLNPVNKTLDNGLRLLSPGEGLDSSLVVGIDAPFPGSEGDILTIFPKSVDTSQSVSMYANKVVIGYNPGSKGTLVVDGRAAGSLADPVLNATGVKVGQEGTGILTVQAAGWLRSTGEVVVGNRATGNGSAVTVSGARSKLESAISVQRGGTLNVESGGSVVGGNGSVKGGGAATVSGQNSSWNTSRLTVMGGILDIGNKASVTSTSGSVGHDFGTPGLIRVNNANWTVSGGLTVEDLGAITVMSQGTLSTNGTTVAKGGAMTFESGARMSNSGYTTIEDGGVVSVTGLGTVLTTTGTTVAKGGALSRTLTPLVIFWAFTGL